jgi:hypothetical protein
VTRRILLDTDLAMGAPGSDIDDGFALALALADPDLSVDACKKFWKYMTVHMAHLMGDVDAPNCPAPWMNMPTITKLCDDVVDCLDTVNTKEELGELMWSWFGYTLRLNSWFFLKFPWELGDNYRLKTEEEVKALVDAGELPASVLESGNWKNSQVAA